METPPTVPFLGFRLVAATQREFAEWTAAAARERIRPATIGYLNAATTNMALDRPEIGELFARLDVLYADGRGVVWGAAALGSRLPERVNAGDFVEDFFRDCARDGIRVALVGGYPGEAERFAAAHRARSPGATIVAAEDGFFGPDDEPRVREAVEALDPDVVLLGMGTPKQERLALEWSAAGKPRVWWCVGALFEYDSGSRYRAPVWVRRAGFEWLVRLALEPRRLWRRYLLGNPKFVARIAKARLCGATRRSPDPRDPSRPMEE